MFSQNDCLTGGRFLYLQILLINQPNNRYKMCLHIKYLLILATVFEIDV